MDLRVPDKEIFYLSGPMTGHPDHNYPSFDAGVSILKRFGHEVRSPHERFQTIDATLRDRKPYGFYMRQAIDLMLDCTAIALLPGWDGSKGAKVELAVARACEMKLYLLFLETPSLMEYFPGRTSTIVHDSSPKSPPDVSWIKTTEVKRV